MQKFSELIKKSTEDGAGKKKPAVQKGRFKITKSDDDKMLAFGWANVSITADGELIEDYQEDIIEPEELESAAYKFAELYREKVKSGEYPMFSIEGEAERVEVEEE